MAVVFGSQVVAEEVYTVLSALTEIPDAWKIINLMVVPEGTPLPAVLHYMENGDYTGPIGQAVASERLRYVVRFTCQGQSVGPILTAAAAAFLTLDGHEAQRDGAFLGFDVSGEWPLTTVLEGGTLYRQLGFYLQVDLTQGG